MSVSQRPAVPLEATHTCSIRCTCCPFAQSTDLRVFISRHASAPKGNSSLHLSSVVVRITRQNGSTDGQELFVNLSLLPAAKAGPSERIHYFNNTPPIVTTGTFALNQL